MEDLVPGKNYFLKWASVKPNGTIHNMVVLEGEFIKYYDNKYYENYVNYMNNTDIEPHEELIGTILNPDERNIQFPFDNPLYPYSNMHTRFPLKENSFKNMGLFRILRLVKTVFKGVPDAANWNDPYRFINLSYNTMINRNNSNNKINYGETLMWVNLNDPDTSIRPVIDKVKLLQEKAVETFEIPAAKEDMHREIKSYLGGKKRRKTNRRRKTNKRRKTNRRRKTNKQRK